MIMIVRVCRLRDRANSFWVWTHGLFADSYWETNKIVLLLLLTDNERSFFIFDIFVLFSPQQI